MLPVPASSLAWATRTLDRRAGEQEQRAGVRRERERQQEPGRRELEPDRDHDGHRDERRDRAVRRDQRGQQRREAQHGDEEAVAPAPRRRDQPLPRPRRHAGGVKRLADDEQRHDEDHGLVAEARKRLGDRQHAGRVQRQRCPEGDDADRYAVGDEQHDRAAEHEERDRRIAHSRHCAICGRRAAAAPEPLMEVRDGFQHRAFRRPADDGPVHEAPPSRPRRVLDDDPIRELSVAFREVTLVVGGGKTGLLARVLNQPVWVNPLERHVERDPASGEAEHDARAVAGTLPARLGLDADRSRPVLEPVARVSDVVEPLARGDREAARGLHPDHGGLRRSA
jgi:hypothetical protein